MKTSNRIPDPPMTIDLLILSAMGDGKLHTIREIAALWGEDQHRVQEWLFRFKKQGLVKTSRSGNECWVGNVAAIMEYIEKRKENYI